MLLYFISEIEPGSLIYFNTDLKPPIQQREKFQNFRATQLGSRLHNLDRHHKHYRKGNNDIIRNFGARNENTERNANRQGRNCRGVCKFIPDRDFCPTDVVEDTEAVEDYYSDENNSLEDSEEYYDDGEYEDDDEDYDEDDNEIRRTEPMSPNSAVKNGNLSPVYGVPHLSNLHIVNPSFTRFVASRIPGANSSTATTFTKKPSPVRRKPVLKRRQQQRRLKHTKKHREPTMGNREIARAPALEQGS